MFFQYAARNYIRTELYRANVASQAMNKTIRIEMYTMLMFSSTRIPQYNHQAVGRMQTTNAISIMQSH